MDLSMWPDFVLQNTVEEVGQSSSRSGPDVAVKQSQSRV